MSYKFYYLQGCDFQLRVADKWNFMHVETNLKTSGSVLGHVFYNVLGRHYTAEERSWP